MRKKMLLVSVLIALTICSAIGFVSCGKKEEHVHDYKLTYTVDATCVEGGVTEYKCDCGETKRETTPALGHTGGTATCKEKAVCTRCKNEYGELAEHKWDKEAVTCEEDRECSVCHTKEKALGHTGGTATCKEKAVCTRCGNEYGELAEHNWEKNAVTCEEGRECSVCHTEEKPLGHHHVLAKEVPATCTEEGKNIYECDRIGCADKYEVVTEPAKGHSVKDEDFSATTKELSSVKELCYIQNYEAVCKDCNAKIEKKLEVKEHATVKKIVTEANCRNHGEYEYNCTHCGYSYKENYEDSDAHKWSESGTKDGEIITYPCTVDGCEEKRTVISAKEQTDTTTDADTLKKAGEVELKEASIALDKDTLDNLTGRVNISANIVAENELSEEQKAAINGLNGKVYNFTMSVDDEEHHEFGGKVTIKIPYTLEEGDDPDNLVVCYLNDKGELESKTAKYSNGFAVFETEHFSYYTVTRMTAKERCEKFGHAENFTKSDPSCTATGYTLVVCIRCGEMKKNIIPALGHTYGEPQIIEATCTGNGRKTYTCEKDGCGYSYITVIPATGHNWEKSEVKNATCTESGYEKYDCQNKDCTATYRTNLPKTAHDYIETVHPATCTEEGYTEHECSFCHKSYTDKKIGKLGHKEVKTVVEATCTADGYTEYKCSRCGETRKTDEVKAHHTWDIETPTCGKGQTCTGCGEKGLPATGDHKYNDSGICTVCGNGCEHDFNDGEIVAPTCTEQGYTLKTCNKCGHTEKTDYTAALGHKGANGVCDRCGAEIPVVADPMKNFINSFLNSRVTLVIKDADFDIPVDYNETTKGKIKFAEIAAWFDDDGEIVMNGKGNVVICKTDEITLANDATVIIKGGYAYVCIESDVISMGSYDGAEYIEKADDVGYVKCPVNLMFGDDEESETVQTIIKTLGIYESKVMPLVRNAADIENGAIRKLAEKMIADAFDITETASGYEALLSFEKLGTLNHKLATTALSALVDETFGEGVFDSVASFAEGAFDKTIAGLLEDITDKGIDAEGVLKALDEFYKLGKAAEDSFKPSDIIAMSKSDKYASFKIGELIVRQNSKDTEMTQDDVAKAVTKLKESVKQYFDSVKEMDFYTFLGTFSSKKENPDNPGASDAEVDIESEIADILALAKDMAELKFNADGSGNFLSAVLNINGENLDGNGNGSIFGTISFINGYTMQTDFDKEYEEIATALSSVDFKAVATALIAQTTSGEYTYDERSCSVIATVSSDIEEKECELISELRNNGYTIKVKSTANVIIKLNDYYILSNDCGDNIVLQIFDRYYNKTVYEIKLYYNGEETEDYSALGDKLFEAISNGFGLNVKTLGVYEEEHTTLGHTVVIYNKATKTVKTNVNTEHKWVKQDALSKPATCSSFGEDHYKCSVCGETYVYYYTEAHEEGRTEYKFLTDSHNCEDGVEINYYCKNCGEKYKITRTYTHYDLDKEVDISGNGVCDKHKVVERFCPCGEEHDVVVLDKLKDRWENRCEFSYLESDSEGEIYYYTCYDCGFTVYRKTISSKENCVRHSTITYKIGKVNRASADEYEEAPANEYYHGMERDPGFSPEVRRGNLFKVSLDHGERMFAFKPTTSGKYVVYSYSENGRIGVYDLRLYTKNGGYVYNRTNGYISIDLEADELCFVMLQVVDFDVTLYIEPDCYAGANLDVSFCDPIILNRDIADHSEVRYVKLAEGSTDCEDGVYVTTVCEDCGEVVYKDELYHWHIDGIVENISLKDYGVDKTITVIGCACGLMSREISVPEGYEIYDEDVEDDGTKIRIYGYRKTDGSVLYIAEKEIEEENENDGCIIDFCKIYLIDYDRESGNYSAEEKIRIRFEERHSYRFVLSEGSVTCEDGIDAICEKCGYTEEHYGYYHEKYSKEDFELSELGFNCGGTASLMTCACGAEQNISINSKCEFDYVSDSTEWLEAEDAVNESQKVCGNTYNYYTYGSVYRCAVTDPECKGGYRYAAYWKRVGSCSAEQYCLYQYGIWESDEFIVKKEVSFKFGDRGTLHNYVKSDNRMVCSDCGSYYTDWIETRDNNGNVIEKRIEWVNMLDDGNSRSYYEILKYDRNERIIYDEEVYVRSSGLSEKYVKEYYADYGYKLKLEMREYANEKGEVTYRDKYEYVYGTDSCKYNVIHSVYYIESGEDVKQYEEFNHSHAQSYIKYPTCTQDGLISEYCTKCGETFGESTEPADGHEWYYFDGKYICYICGLENSNGADGAVVLEDLSYKYGNGENYVLGYCVREYDASFTYSATLMVLNENGEIINEVLFENAVFTDLDGVRAIALSKASVKEFAESMGFKVGEYNLRINFVRVGGWDGLDYAVTFTDDTENDTSEITGKTERLFHVDETTDFLNIGITVEESGYYKFAYFGACVSSCGFSSAEGENPSVDWEIGYCKIYLAAGKTYKLELSINPECGDMFKIWFNLMYTGTFDYEFAA